MDTMMRSLVVKRDIFTTSPPRQGVGMEMRNGYYDKEPCGRKRYPDRESSSIGGRGGDEGQTL